METRPRVLLVDDYEPLVTALTRLLSPYCEIVGSAQGTAELLKEARIRRPDIVVVDLHLSDGNGVDACRQLRSVQPDAKIIMVTADDDAEIRFEALNAGASEFVSKYWTHLQLVPAILRLCAL